MDNQITFSPLIIGTMRWGVWGAKLETSEVEQLIDHCLDLGLRDFDHADIYGHYTEEENFGRVIKRRPDLKSKIQITTKYGIKMITENRPSHQIKSYNSSKEHLLLSVDNSLRALGVDQIDVLLLHRPDLLMNPHDIAEGYEQLHQAGKVRSFGVSNFTTHQFDLLNDLIPLITNQLEISLLHLDAFQDGTLTQCQRSKISPTAWSPFGGGRIFTDREDEQSIRIRKAAQPLMEKYDATLDQILLAWLYKHPAGIIPVLGSSKPERITVAAQAQYMALSHQEWYKLWEASVGQEVP
ncbi:MAG: aldo/keto reductase [Saprospiraceae bacterium]|nr:aldo/keto reductase [Saprospiraceae bacterium]